MIAFDLRFYERLGSTQDEARRLMRMGAAHGTVVTAGEQTAGRGRHGRRWASPPGNVYLSVLLRLDLPPAQFAELGFVAALAAVDVVDAVVPGRATLKWPNDVLVDGAKISGILVEQADQAAIVGIGLNVLHVPDGVRDAATSLLSLTRRPDARRPLPQGQEVEAMRAALLDAFGARLDEWQSRGFAAIRVGWLARAHPPGTGLRVSTGAGPIEGRFAGIADDGALLLDTEGGVRRVIAGEVLVE